MNSQKFSKETGGDMKILTDFSLWNLLMKDLVPSRRRKLSKAEAFYDLLTRQRQAVFCGQNALFGNFQTLAENWNWHRQTVKKFLCELKTIGAVQIEQDSNRTIIRVANVTMTPTDIAGGHTNQGVGSLNIWKSP